nr:Uncharacterised protein [Klebsiella pneumoniae]
METLMLLTYAALCIVVFKVFASRSISGPYRRRCSAVSP